MEKTPQTLDALHTHTHTHTHSHLITIKKFCIKNKEQKLTVFLIVVNVCSFVAQKQFLPCRGGFHIRPMEK
jgi:hypothetical protein